jgi:hypothetical protein
MWNPVWVAFATGIFLGVCIGVFVMCCLDISRCTECVGRKLWGEDE